MNHRHAAFVAYEVALSRNPPDPGAWAEAFPDLPPEKLDDELAHYLDGGQYELLVSPFKPPAFRIVHEGTLTDADTHAIRALLVGAAGRDPKLHRREIPAAETRARGEQEAGEALRAAPTHLLAQAVRAFLLENDLDLETARATARAHPNEWMAWLLLYRALKHQGVTEGLSEALDRAVVLAGRDPAVTLYRSVRLTN
jgi:hypothetical protein